jgi:hypothetical protein
VLDKARHHLQLTAVINRVLASTIRALALAYEQDGGKVNTLALEVMVVVVKEMMRVMVVRRPDVRHVTLVFSLLHSSLSLSLVAQSQKLTFLLSKNTMIQARG